MYGIIGGNLLETPGGTLLAAGVAIVASAVIAAAFGYFVFYGQLSGWIIPLLLLVLSLILETFTAQTAGYQWRVGSISAWGVQRNDQFPSSNWIRDFGALLSRSTTGGFCDAHHIPESQVVSKFSLWSRCSGDKRRYRADPNAGIQRQPNSDSGVCFGGSIGWLKWDTLRFVGQLYQPVQHGSLARDPSRDLDCSRRAK